ncbi:MAG: ATP synthase F0 subunit B [Deltaproteobacteria bacterium]|nr:ATP synthase F0 subunit B [Deltaproteobacteria bacterium]
MKRAVALVTQILMVGLPAWAAEEAQHAAEHEAHGIPWSSLLFSTINFAIFIGILGRFVWPTVKSWLKERHDSVVAALEAAANAKAEAERMQAQWQQRMAQLETEIASLREQARKDMDLERERILAAARKTADSIRRDAERAAAAEVRQAQQALRAQLVGQAVRLAAEATQKGWTADDQQRSIQEFLKQVES